MLLDHCDVDVVIDTCVLVHACGHDATAGAAMQIFSDLLDDPSLLWILDDNGKAAPDLSTSTLYSEYYNTVNFDSYPMVVLSQLLQSSRVAFSARPDRTLRSKVRKLIPGHPADQVILGAAANTQDKLLLSDNTQEFAKNRTRIRKEVGVSVLEALEV